MVSTVVANNVETARAIFVKYAHQGRDATLPVVAITIYVNKDVWGSLSFKQLDDIARPKRFRNDAKCTDILLKDLTNVSLENLAEKVIVSVDPIYPVSFAFEKEIYPHGSIIWFELESSPTLEEPKKALPSSSSSSMKKGEKVHEKGGKSERGDKHDRNHEKHDKNDKKKDHHYKPDSKVDAYRSTLIGNGNKNNETGGGSGTSSGATKGLISGVFSGVSVNLGPKINVNLGPIAPPGSTAGGTLNQIAGDKPISGPLKSGRSLHPDIPHGRIDPRVAKPTAASKINAVRDKFNLPHLRESPRESPAGSPRGSPRGNSTEIDISKMKGIEEEEDIDSDFHWSGDEGENEENGGENEGNEAVWDTGIEGNEDEGGVGGKDEDKENEENNVQVLRSNNFRLWLEPIIYTNDGSHNNEDNDNKNNISTNDNSSSNDKLTPITNDHTRKHSNDHNNNDDNDNIDDSLNNSNDDIDILLSCLSDQNASDFDLQKYQNIEMNEKHDENKKNGNQTRVGTEFQAEVGDAPGLIEGDCSELFEYQNVAEICVWSSSQCDESGVDEYLHKLKNEQLKNVCKGDFLWAFSSCIDKKDPPNSPRISSRIPNHENRPVFVCVTENRNSTFEESIGGGFELDEDDQGNDFAELRVFDGQDGYSVISYDCEPVSKLSYYFMTEERALQILMESKGNFIKALNTCRSEIKVARSMSIEEQLLMRKNKCPPVYQSFSPDPPRIPSPQAIFRKKQSGSSLSSHLSVSTLLPINNKIIPKNSLSNNSNSFQPHENSIFDHYDPNDNIYGKNPNGRSSFSDIIEGGEMMDIDDSNSEIDNINKEFASNEKKNVRQEIEKQGSIDECTIQYGNRNSDTNVVAFKSKNEDYMGNDWLLHRRWLPTTIKEILPALTEITKLDRVLKNLNKRLTGVNLSDRVKTSDCVHLYYLFGEPFLVYGGKLFKDVIRKQSWASNLYAVMKRSHEISGRKSIRKGSPSDCVIDKELNARPDKTKNLFKSAIAGKSSLKSVLKSSGTSLSSMASSRGSKPRVLKSVALIDDRDRGGAAAFERLEHQRVHSTSLISVPENHQSLSSDELNVNDYSEFDVKFDCSKALSVSTGLNLQGARGMYKIVLDLTGVIEETSLVKVGDFLLSIDRNDVRDMTMIGLVTFLRRIITQKMTTWKDTQADELAPFKKRYILLQFRRMGKTITQSSNELKVQMTKTKEAESETRFSPDTATVTNSPSGSKVHKTKDAKSKAPEEDDDTTTTKNGFQVHEPEDAESQANSTAAKRKLNDFHNDEAADLEVAENIRSADYDQDAGLKLDAIMESLFEHRVNNLKDHRHDADISLEPELNETEKSPAEPKKTRKYTKKVKYNQDAEPEVPPVKKRKYRKRVRTQSNEEAEFEDIANSDDDNGDEAAAIIMRKQILAARMQVNDKVLHRDFDATVLEVNEADLLVNLRWFRGDSTWVDIDPCDLVLQADYVVTTRRR